MKFHKLVHRVVRLVVKLMNSEFNYRDIPVYIQHEEEYSGDKFLVPIKSIDWNQDTASVIISLDYENMINPYNGS